MPWCNQKCNGDFSRPSWSCLVCSFLFCLVLLIILVHKPMEHREDQSRATINHRFPSPLFILQKALSKQTEGSVWVIWYDIAVKVCMLADLILSAFSSVRLQLGYHFPHTTTAITFSFPLRTQTHLSLFKALLLFLYWLKTWFSHGSSANSTSDILTHHYSVFPFNSILNQKGN